jgi:hypothetical protein
MGRIMYEPGKKLVIRENNRERTVIVEDLLADEEGNKLRVRDLDSHATRVIKPEEHVIVEHLED